MNEYGVRILLYVAILDDPPPYNGRGQFGLEVQDYSSAKYLAFANLLCQCSIDQPTR